MNRMTRFAPLAGVAFAILGFAGFAISKANKLSFTASGTDVITFYRAHHAGQATADILETVAFAMLVLFVGSIRGRLRQHGDGEMAATVALVGAGVMAAGALVFLGVDYTLASANGHLTPDVAQALNFLSFRLVLPACAGTLVFGIGMGVAVIRSGVLPRWLGWVAIVVGLIGCSPLLTVAFVVLYVWSLIVAFVLMVRSHSFGGLDLPTVPAKAA